MTGIDRLADAERMLAEVASIDDARQLVDIAEAARVYARQVRLGTSSVNHATSIKLRAERRVADLVDEGQASGVIATQGKGKPADAAGLINLADLGIAYERLVEHRLLRDTYSDADIAAAIAEADRIDREVSRAALIADARRRRAQAADRSARHIDAATELADEAGERWQLLAGDMRDRLVDLPDASVDMIVTDPPYSREALPLWTALAEHAARLLVPGGVLVALTGKIMLDEVIARLAEHLSWGWCYVQPLPGPSSRILARHVGQEYKPWLAFTRGAWPSGRIDWHGDMLHGVPKMKDLYGWQQSEAPAGELIVRLSTDDALVLDPFAGSGSYGVAALLAGRRFVGVEIDVERAEITARRLKATSP
jgi:site-specific DNA-methyltransferase (adenine-specific)